MKAFVMAALGGMALFAAMPAAAQPGSDVDKRVHGPMKILPRHHRKVCSVRYFHHKRVRKCRYY